MADLGKITEIKEISELKLENTGHLNGKNGSQLGMSSLINALGGFNSYDGYQITTDKHIFYILISNDQCCCESWGYFYLNDDETAFIGSQLLEVNTTDTALNKEKLEENGAYGLDEGGIQFVDFETDKGVLQFAVYNAHNGYYGHPIIFAKDEEIFLQDTL